MDVVDYRHQFSLLPMMPGFGRLHFQSGEPANSDGPFAETKEQLAGFYLPEARDLDEAIQLAGKIPPARYGCVEVRPIRRLPPRQV